VLDSKKDGSIDDPQGSKNGPSFSTSSSSSAASSTLTGQGSKLGFSVSLQGEAHNNTNDEHGSQMSQRDDDSAQQPVSSTDTAGYKDNSHKMKDSAEGGISDKDSLDCMNYTAEEFKDNGSTHSTASQDRSMFDENIKLASADYSIQ
jgi:hypothetical protein